LKQTEGIRGFVNTWEDQLAVETASDLGVFHPTQPMPS